MKFRLLTFIKATFIICILTFLSLVGAGAVDEGTEGSGILYVVSHIFSTLFYVFRFPMHTFFFQWMDGSMFIIGLCINCLFWGLIIERIIYYKSKNNSAR